MASSELKELKSVLRSLVVSSPTQVDVRSLLRDYRNMMGAPVPLAKYGYRDPMEFLRERCSDCFVFQGPASNPVLTLIVPETLKHIDEFVQRQKVSSTVKFKGKRRSIPEKNLKSRNLVASTFVPQQVDINKRPIQKSVETHGNVTHKPADIYKTKHVENNSYSVRDQNKKPLKVNSTTCSTQNILDNKNSTTQNKENELANANSQHEENHSKNAVLNFLRKRMPMYSSSNHIESEASFDGKTSSKEDEDSGRHTSSSGSSSTKAARLEELKIEIRDLVADYPEGIWCTDLIGLYRQRYHRELNFTRFGFTSIVSLVCVMEDVVRVWQQPQAGDWLLTDARALAAPPRPRRYVPAARAPAALGVDADDALPGIDFDPDVFPVDCVNFMESIPPAPLAGLEAGSMLEVIVGEVYSPSHFWLLRLGDQYNIAMENIMDEMTEYYTYGEGKDRSLTLGAVRVGHYCSSVYERDWHRSLIVRIVDSDTVKLRHVDYGTVESARLAELKPLRRGWARLPAQAVRARLAGARPPAAGRRWPHAACAHFLDLVRDQRLVANVVAVDREEDILEVFLINTSGDEDVCISTEMIKSGHADARADSALRTPECYLFPRFGALEAGDTPNYGEIHAYLRDGIALEYVEEYRRHVPACLPPASPAPPTPDMSSPEPPAPHDPEPEPEPDRSAPSPAPSSVPSGAYSGGFDAASEASEDLEDDEENACPPETPPATPPPRRLTRAASSPGECSSPEPPAHPPRSKSAHPNVAASDACLEVINRVPLWPQQRSAPSPPVEPSPRAITPLKPTIRPPPMTPTPRPTQPNRRFLPPVRTPLAHAYSQMLPMPGYGPFPPFPGAVPVYPAMYTPAPPPLLLHGPFGPATYGHPGPPRPPAAPHPPVSTAPTPSPHPQLSTASASSPFPPVTTAPSPSSPTPNPRHTSKEPIPDSGRSGDRTASSGKATPPPPYTGAGGEVTLSVSECEIYKLLSRVDANAAHWYMVDAISRAMRSPAPSDPPLAAALDSEAAPFRLPADMRPPPGFGF